MASIHRLDLPDTALTRISKTAADLRLISGKRRAAVELCDRDVIELVDAMDRSLQRDLLLALADHAKGMKR